jgi:general stress protein YciG
MNQHEFVAGCLAFYAETEATPEPGWQKAHYPTPKHLGGEKVVWLTFDHHQEQGLLQSEEYQCVCFHNGEAKKFLNRNPTRLDLWEIYDKWKKCNGKTNVVAMNDHPNTIAARIENGSKQAIINFPAEKLKENGRKGGKKTGKKNAVANFTPEVINENGKRQAAATNVQRWQCLVTGHVNNPGSLTHYQKARGIDTALRVRLES